jgi:hypothetical protein
MTRLLSYKYPAILYVVACLVTSIHKFTSNDFNGYSVIKYSFINLISRVDLYVLHPEQYVDMYRYSPFFSLFVSPFAYLPDYLGSVLWNLTGTIILLAGVYCLPYLNKNIKGMILYFCFFEYLASIQEFQSTVLIVGLILLTFYFFEAGKLMLAGLTVALLASIKIYGIAIGLMFLLYPNKRKFLLWSSVYLVGIIILPSIITGLGYLAEQYHAWQNLLSNDLSEAYGYSIMSLLDVIVPVERIYIQYFGVFILMALFVFYRDELDYRIRYMLLSMIMIWLVIFNHRAESPTYIIATVAVVVAYFNTNQNIVLKLLLATVFVFTTIVFNYVSIPLIKVIPCFVMWLYILIALAMEKSREFRSS